MAGAWGYWTAEGFLRPFREYGADKSCKGSKRIHGLMLRHAIQGEIRAHGFSSRR